MFVGMGANSPSGYNITDSLRLRGLSGANISRTFTATGNQKTWTWSAWLKRGSLGALQTPFYAGNSTTTQRGGLFFTASDTIQVSGMTSGTTTTSLVAETTAVFRDPSAWYHVVWQLDTTQATGSNRTKVFVNGVQQTLTFSTTPAQNVNLHLNQSGIVHATVHPSGDYEWEGYMTEVNFVDGQALDPSYFGETNTDGVWSPIAYTGTYGTNGFYLNFSDGTSTTTLGYDYSGNSNNWTTNNISLTAGSTYDLMSDTPTLTDEDTSNFATLNPLVTTVSGTSTITNGNLTLTGTSSNGVRCSTIGVSSDKWYAEITLTANPSNSDPVIGVVNANNTVISYPGQTSDSYGIYCYPSNTYLQKVNNGTFTNTNTTTSTTGNIISVAIDVTNNKIWFAKNGVWTDSGNPATATNPAFTISSGTYYFAARGSGGAGTAILDWNFGQRPFAYTPPTGYKKLNTYNLPDSSITDGSNHFNTVTYTGDGVNGRNITGVGFDTNFLWIKDRSGTGRHSLHDIVRGDGKRLISDGTDAESSTGSYPSFITDGFTVPSSSAYNASGTSYVAWNWKANGSGVSNTDGTITSTVSANTTSGFSVVTYIGTGANATVGHGLGVAPKMIIAKCRGAASQWAVYHSNVDATPQNYTLLLNSTAAKELNSLYWNNTAPTSTVVSLGGSSAANTNGQTQVAYCFAEVEGFSKFGSYTGNGSTDGPFVYTGFKPAFILYKNSSSGTAYWRIFDTTRNPYNANNNALYPNASIAEDFGSGPIDILSNGFKIRTSQTNDNGSGNTIIYMAFAENPFKNSLAR